MASAPEHGWIGIGAVTTHFSQQPLPEKSHNKVNNTSDLDGVRCGLPSSKPNRLQSDWGLLVGLLSGWTKLCFVHKSLITLIRLLRFTSLFSI